jgi:hypothetical protein
MHGVRDFCPVFASLCVRDTNRSCHITATLNIARTSFIGFLVFTVFTIAAQLQKLTARQMRARPKSWCRLALFAGKKNFRPS